MMIRSEGGIAKAIFYNHNAYKQADKNKDVQLYRSFRLISGVKSAYNPPTLPDHGGLAAGCACYSGQP